MDFTDVPRPTAGPTYYKGHGLGNDYLVFEEGPGWRLSPGSVEAVCDRWTGVGSDGIVILTADRTGGVFRLRMFNPDGSEFERSGNGLRVLGSHLVRKGWVGSDPFVVEVGGDRVVMTVHGVEDGVHDISVAMGRATTGPAAVAMDPGALGPGGTMEGPDGRVLEVVPVSVGNPHVVVWMEDPGKEDLSLIGPWLATHPSLAGGTNVQLACSTAAGACRILIWERGVGPTSASGTSSCAAAVSAVARGEMVAGEIRVLMPGGEFLVTVTEELDVVLRGPVAETCEGSLTPGFLTRLDGGR
ncbi:MAG: diaminopimelate epimerase [Gemmatimonadota bacterium]|nr:diaminopimelate epimerase [Gemmatimonadota bacterium]